MQNAWNKSKYMQLIFHLLFLVSKRKLSAIKIIETTIINVKEAENKCSKVITRKEQTAHAA